MYKDKFNTIHVWQSLVVIPIVGFLSFLEVEVPFLHNSLVGTPFLALVTLMSLFGDFLAGLSAIVFGTVCISFIGPQGWHLNDQSLLRTLEFILVGILIYLLSWRSRNLSKNAENLEVTVQSLKKASTKLKSQVRVTKRDVSTLRSINKDLQSIVDDVMNDKGLWASSVERDIKDNDKKATSVSRKRA